jgi:drug/metabolite transporter (DMT)-like permease
VSRARTAHSRAAVELSVGIAIFSVQDVILKWLSGAYPVHEALAIRSAVAMPILFWMVRRAGGLRAADASWKVLTARGALLLVSYGGYYMALAALPLASAVALWFTAPLFVTAMSGAITGEPPTPHQWGAVVVGFGGVLVIVRPGGGLFHWSAALPILAALGYAMAQLVARRLGGGTGGSAMAFHQNLVYGVGAIVVALVVRPFASVATSDRSMAFLLRGWVVPSSRDLLLLALCGPIAAFGTTLLSNAYRAAGSRMAPFEYSAMLSAIVWGYVVFGDRPDAIALGGAAIIVASGSYAITRARAPGPPQRPPGQAPALPRG